MDGWHGTSTTQEGARGWTGQSGQNKGLKTIPPTRLLIKNTQLKKEEEEEVEFPNNHKNGRPNSLLDFILSIYFHLPSPKLSTRWIKTHFYLLLFSLDELAE